MCVELHSRATDDKSQCSVECLVSGNTAQCRGFPSCYRICHRIVERQLTDGLKVVCLIVGQSELFELKWSGSGEFREQHHQPLGEFPGFRFYYAASPVGTSVDIILATPDAETIPEPMTP